MPEQPTILTCTLCGAIVFESSEEGLALESRIHVTVEHPDVGAGVQFIEWRPTIHNTPRANLLGELNAERERQETLHYDLVHDDEHGLDHLLSIAGNYAVETTTVPAAPHDQRRALIKCAALVIAAIELLDRKA